MLVYHHCLILYIQLFVKFIHLVVVAATAKYSSLPFAELLNRLHEGSHTADNVQLLNTRTITPDVDNYPTSAQHLSKTNAPVELHNTSAFDKSA